MAKPSTRRARMEARTQADFHETLAGTMPLSVAAEPTVAATSRRRPIVGISLWAVSVILVGVGLGLVLRIFLYPAAYEVVQAGIVATVADPPFDRVATAQTLSAPLAVATNLEVTAYSQLKPVDLAVQPSISTASSLIPVAGLTALQQPMGLASFQPSFSGYGLQGSVGTAAAQ